MFCLLFIYIMNNSSQTIRTIQYKKISYVLNIKINTLHINILYYILHINILYYILDRII